MTLGSGSLEAARTPSRPGARREALEEAGVAKGSSFFQLRTIDSVPVADFVARPVWPPDTYVIPQHFFACEAESLIATLSAEHAEWRWVNYGDAVELLRYHGNRTALFELAERLRGDDLPEPI
jgi:8-oxo-dGTP pyrophosphatase MutT (NUDIX family)